jgi:two-component system, chemotaxis family, protein-glutamate methylesterase/glutaminase
VVIGASAGGVQVLTRLASGLPPDLGAAVCIVLHVAPSSPSMLAKILDRAGPLPCRAARDGDRLHSGLILVAPPDHHLAIEDGHVRLTVGPRENGHRPAIDVLFRSAAEALDSRVVGVILSGTRDDGSAGLAQIKATGGVAIVQDPDEATYSGMPASAIANVRVDAIVTSDRLARTIVAMVKGEDPSPDTPSEQPPDPDPPAANPDPIGGGSQLSPGQRSRAGDEPPEKRGQIRSARRFRRQAESASEQAHIVRQVLTGAAQSTLRRVTDGGDELGEEGAA